METNAASHLCEVVPAADRKTQMPMVLHADEESQLGKLSLNLAELSGIGQEAPISLDHETFESVLRTVGESSMAAAVLI